MAPYLRGQPVRGCVSGTCNQPANWRSTARGPKHFQGLSFAHDGHFLATVSNDATVRIWDTRTWEEHSQFTWKIGALLNISFAPDGLCAAAGQ